MGLSSIKLAFRLIFEFGVDNTFLPFLQEFFQHGSCHKKQEYLLIMSHEYYGLKEFDWHLTYRPLFAGLCLLPHPWYIRYYGEIFFFPFFLANTKYVCPGNTLRLSDIAIRSGIGRFSCQHSELYRSSSQEKWTAPLRGSMVGQTRSRGQFCYKQQPKQFYSDRLITQNLNHICRTSNIYYGIWQIVWKMCYQCCLWQLNGSPQFSDMQYCTVSCCPEPSSGCSRPWSLSVLDTSVWFMIRKICAIYILDVSSTIQYCHSFFYIYKFCILNASVIWNFWSSPMWNINRDML